MKDSSTSTLLNFAPPGEPTALDAEPRIAAYTVESENFESIHNHSTYALIRHDKRA